MALVKNLALATNTHGMWVTEYFPEAQLLRALEFWFGGKFIPYYEHNLADTGYELVIESRDLVHFAEVTIQSSQQIIKHLVHEGER